MKITIKAILTIVLMFPLFVQAQNNAARIDQIGNVNSGFIEQTGSAQWAALFQQNDLNTRRSLKMEVCNDFRFQFNWVER